METSLSRFAMILDSVQSDVMQLRDVLNQIKGQEEIKASIDGNLKLLSEQLCKFTSQEKSQEVSLIVSTLPQIIETSFKSLQQEIHAKFTEEMQEISCNLKRFNQRDLAQSTLSTKSISNQVTKREWPQPPNIEANNTLHGTVASKEEMEIWKQVKRARVTFSDKCLDEQKQKEPYTEKYVRGGKESVIVIDSSSEETAGSCSCFEENIGDLYGSFTKEETEEAQRIIQRARKRKRRLRLRTNPLSGFEDNSRLREKTPVVDQVAPPPRPFTNSSARQLGRPSISAPRTKTPSSIHLGIFCPPDLFRSRPTNIGAVCGDV
ncbi:putative recombination initiation defects 3 [Arachis stenosperma]|uniref:putative recombination initiation defects 3 n=1 Tax=Arachis stenosperma TaxID=217475 RepID=UPI0025ABAE09|nr:putative recombination initiation defects 3 [Arachis stenosperma]